MQVIMTMEEYEKLKKDQQEIRKNIFNLLKDWAMNAKFWDDERADYLIWYDDFKQQLDEWLRDEWK